MARGVYERTPSLLYSCWKLDFLCQLFSTRRARRDAHRGPRQRGWGVIAVSSVSALPASTAWRAERHLRERGAG